ncbi:hypothetical protein H6P81_002175 [Aristolochia fimbriata]|uniref:Integrase zinc-binding domain-containing protein n=1 Tax=Aristolochia fimbriata TaxID=158543 RepID=A0AAV7FD48_ARIFI|nr:hypothetical protein H6P81_002175 [Aristolochia fimbriata]
MRIRCHLGQILGIHSASLRNRNRPVKNRCNSKGVEAQKRLRTQELLRPFGVHSAFYFELSREVSTVQSPAEEGPSTGKFLGRPPGASQMGINRRVPGRRNLPGRSASPLGDVFRRCCAKKRSQHECSICFTEKGPDLVFIRLYSKLFEQRSRVSSYPPRARHGGRYEIAAVKHLRRLGSGHQATHRGVRSKETRTHAGELLAQISEASLHYVPRSENGPVDALAGIAASLAQFDERPSQVLICERWVIPPPVEEETEEEYREEIEESLTISASQNEAEDWQKPISNFLRYDTLPVDLRERVQIRRAAPTYVFINIVLYGRSYEGLLLRCPSKEEGQQVLKETHKGICGAHQAGPKLHLQVKRLGYYWPSTLRDATEMVRTCKPCQLHADYIHQLSEPLHPTIASWPFEAWGTNIIGPITPKSNSDRQYILEATDYSSKWAETTAY